MATKNDDPKDGRFARRAFVACKRCGTLHAPDYNHKCDCICHETVVGKNSCPVHGSINDLLEAQLVEALADYAHDAWSGWMRYLFSKCLGVLDHGADACETVIPEWATKRWRRQMNTPYKDLPEEEKESDRVEARKILSIINKLMEQ